MRLVLGDNALAAVPAVTGGRRPAVYARTWKTEARSVASPFIKPGTLDFTLHNEYWKS